MKKRFFLYNINYQISLAFTLLFVIPCLSEPFLAIRNGYKCSICHVNKTGGGQRTDFGYVFSQTELPQTFLNPSKSKTGFDRKLNQSISVGGNLKIENFTFLPAKSKDKIPTSSLLFPFRDTTFSIASSSQIRVPEGNLYLQMVLIDDFLKAYVDQTISPGPGSREAFIMLEPRIIDSYIKFGKMLQPYGIRLYDDLTSTREVTQFTYANPKIGMEGGIEPGPYFASLSIAESQASFLNYFAFNHLRVISSMQIGGSIFRTYPSIQEIFSSTDKTDLGFNVFGGFSFLKMTLFGEYGVLKTIEDNKEVWKDIGFVELDWFLMQGLNFKVEFDWLNPDNNSKFSRNGESRTVLGIEYFPFQFFQLGAYYHFRQSRPDDINGQQDQLRFLIHTFY